MQDTDKKAEGAKDYTWFNKAIDIAVPVAVFALSVTAFRSIGWWITTAF
jgi:hypothetical protein